MTCDLDGFINVPQWELQAFLEVVDLPFASVLASLSHVKTVQSPRGRMRTRLYDSASMTLH